MSILVVSLFLSVTFSQYISIQWGDKTVQMFCPQIANIIFDKETNPNTPAWAILAMDFDPSEVSFAANNFSFSNLFQGWWIAPSLVNGLAWANSRLFAQRWWLNNTLPDNWLVWTFSFASKKTLSTNFNFYYSGQGFTDVISDTDLYYNNGEDMLLYASGSHLDFLTGLCDPDVIWPLIYNFSPDITAHTRTVGNWPYSRTPAHQVTEKIYNRDGLSFIVRDGDSYNKNQPWYISWTYPNLDINDFWANTAGSGVYSPLNVADRASWIDPDSLQFKLSNTATVFNQYNVASLAAINGYTRDRRNRDYSVILSSGQINDYGIEEEIIFSWFAKEHSNKFINASYTFNSPVDPWLTNLNPHNGQEQILPRSDIKLRVRDDRSGIDPSTLVVTVMHGATILWIFSWTQLHLEAVSWAADSDDFNIFIYSWTERNNTKLTYPIPTILNTANTITVVVDVADYKSNSPSTPHDRYSFDTRYSCLSYTGCQDPLTVFMFQDGVWEKERYLNTSLFVTWAVWTGTPPVPYVNSWTQMLYCGDNAPNILSWIMIEWTYIDNPQLYTWNKLYFQGAQVLVSGNTIIFWDF